MRDGDGIFDDEARTRGHRRSNRACQRNVIRSVWSD